MVLRFFQRLAGAGLALCLSGGLSTEAGAVDRNSEPVTFHEHVAPVLFRHCSGCHHGTEIAPFPLVTFVDARKHGREMAKVTESRYMPPWPPAHGVETFEGERRLSDAEIAVFRKWLDGGMAEGDPAKSPPVPARSGDWELGPPDLIVRMPEPYLVPAGGKDVYRNFVVPVPSGPRRYVKAWQFRPHSRAVHHTFLCLDRSGVGRRRDALDSETGFPGMDMPMGIELPSGHFTSWQPGAGARRIREGLAWALEPGMELVLQMHLQPIGRMEPVQSEVGFYFTNKEPSRQPVKVSLIQYAIDIPAGASNVVVTDDYVLPAAASLLGVLPHSHYLCRRIEAQAYLPDGGKRGLFLIPDWDFNWQGDYTYRTPPKLPAGTRIVMEITFDNSASNPRNPSNPPRRVRYGTNTTDEMAELWMQFLPDTAEGDARFRQVGFDRGLRDTQAANEQRLRMDPRDARAMVNLGRVALARRQPEQAYRHFNEALAVDPTLDDAHYNIGLLFRVARRPDDALRAFRTATEINPGNARAFGNLGLLLAEREENDGAAAALTQAIKLDPGDALATSTLGSIRFNQGRFSEAVELFSTAVRLSPDDPEVRRHLEMARQRAGTPGPVAPP